MDIRYPGASKPEVGRRWTPDRSTTLLRRVLAGLSDDATTSDLVSELSDLLAAAIDQVGAPATQAAAVAVASAREILTVPLLERQLGSLTHAAERLQPFVVDPEYVPAQGLGELGAAAIGASVALEPAAVYANFTPADHRVVRTWLSRLWIKCARVGGEVVVDAHDVGSHDVPLGQRPNWQKIVARIEGGFVRLLVVSSPEELLSPSSYTKQVEYEQAQSYMASWFRQRNVRLVFLTDALVEEAQR
ncbi:hypothetical protein [Streptomyces sp. YIM 121038]|uniref:hypothetical protein n=1 Tax=Streptomyces sp. YIM 121038 TaxID=2136401 RepID=UPI001110CAD3|nr:hypothetical protein [Streptomyces sp. YIM 121038]